MRNCGWQEAPAASARPAFRAKPRAG